MISTHTLRKEGDQIFSHQKTGEMIFQPTPSARRVTRVFSSTIVCPPISTHTLRKEGDREYWLEEVEE